MHRPLLKLLLIGCLALPVSSHAREPGLKSSEAIMLDDLLGGENLWNTTPAQFEGKFRNARLQWLSQARDQARFFGNYGAWNGELKVSEALVEFQGGKLFRVNLSLFNRGDSRTEIRSKAELDAMIETVKKSVTARAGVQPVDLGKQGASAVKALGFAWVSKPSVYLLEYSFEKEDRLTNQDFRTEFVRLRVYEAPKQLGFGTKPPTTAGAGSQVSKSSLTTNVVRESGGDIFIKNVPMVDQGPKGYCAVATAERIFRYYGMTVDQHEMAQVANTDSTGGTDPDAMISSLTSLQGRLHIRVRDISKWDSGEFDRMIQDYNRLAKRAGKPEIKISTQHAIDLGKIFGSMDLVILKEARTVKSKAGYTRFQRALNERIDKGVPIMWTVHLGLYPEARIPQSRGGHMRLIIGYNLKTNEIIYSDSWGARHAMKRMPMDNAWSMTTGLYYIEPMQ